VELLCTENNNQTSALGRQSTSVVCGLYLADSLSQLMKTEFNGYVWWDLRNAPDASGSFDPTIYGWRTNGDEGLLLYSNIRYPMFYTDKLMRCFVHPGDTVLNPSSDYPLVGAYGVQRSDGLLNLLVMNKDVTTNFTAQINLTDFVPGGTAMVRSYGILQDEATRTNNPTPGSQDISTNFITVSSTFTNTLPAGTVSLITFFPAQPILTGITPGPATAQIRFAGPYGQPFRVLASSDATIPISQWTEVAGDVFGTTGSTFIESLQPQARFYRIASP
jgi:alpha-N-arabinofuranosidase